MTRNRSDFDIAVDLSTAPCRRGSHRRGGPVPTGCAAGPLHWVRTRCAGHQSLQVARCQVHEPGPWHTPAASISFTNKPNATPEAIRTGMYKYLKAPPCHRPQVTRLRTTGATPCKTDPAPRDRSQSRHEDTHHITPKLRLGSGPRVSVKPGVDGTPLAGREVSAGFEDGLLAA